MSWVERLGRTLSDTVGVGEDGDGGAVTHNDMSGSNDGTAKFEQNGIYSPTLAVSHLGLLQTFIIRGSIAVSTLSLNLFQNAAHPLSRSLFPYFSMCFRQ